MIERERIKYERIWDIPAYRESASPGQILLKRLPIFSWLESYEVKTVLDCGCGEGKMLTGIKKKYPHIKVAGMDIAKNCINERMVDIFTQGCMWKEADYPGDFDAIFAVDVMEHLPTKKVCGVLEILRKKAKKFVFLSICLTDDRLGQQLIKEPLHLTVQPAYWWIRHFEENGFEMKFLMVTESYLDTLLI